MSDKDIKNLSDLAKRKLKEGVTKEEALRSFMEAGILDRNGHFTKPYSILEKVVKKV